MTQEVELENRTTAVLDLAGEETGRTAPLPGELFDVPLNIPLIHQVVEAQLASARAGTHATKTRADVRGGGKKPWRQKGTGRARHGSTRSPMWRGGGVAHGPQNRDYSQRTPKKMIVGALLSALSDRARNEAIVVMEDLVATDTPSTKEAIATLAAVTNGGSVLIVVDRDEDGSETVWKSYHNIPKVHVLWFDQLNAYDVVNADQLLFTEDALTGFISRKMGVVPIFEEKVELKVEEADADINTETGAEEAPVEEMVEEVSEESAKEDDK